jgi:O-antigen ligase
MNEIFYIEDTLTNKISYALLLVFLVALPFDLFYSEMVLVCLAIHTLIQTDWRRPLRMQRPLLLIVSLYAVTMLATLYSSDHVQAWKDWEKQLALLLFPLIFSVTRLDLKKVALPLLTGFACSCLVTCLYLYVEAWLALRYNGLGLRSLFSAQVMSHKFTEPIQLHATYFSMYIALSLVTFVYRLIRSRRTGSRWIHSLMYSLASLGLLAALLQLASRAVWAALLILLVTIPFFLLGARSARKFIFISLPLVFCFLLAMTGIGGLRDRFVADLKDDLSASAETAGVIEPRIVRWGAALQLIKASPWIGHGTGAEVSILKEKYYEQHLYSSYLNELNAHNEYLSLLLKTGVAGLLVFLWLLGTGFSTAIRVRDPFFYAFLTIVFCVCFSENIMDTNKGIFFFSFFFSLFFITSAAKPIIQSSDAHL